MRDWTLQAKFTFNEFSNMIIDINGPGLLILCYNHKFVKPGQD